MVIITMINKDAIMNSIVMDILALFPLELIPVAAMRLYTVRSLNICYIFVKKCK